MRERKVISKNYPVVIVGGGLSGVCAALASARQGVKTAIIQARSVFGGNNSSEVRMHVCGANCHAEKKDLAETGILMELQLLNKQVNPNYSFPMWDMVMWGKLKKEPNLDCYLNTVMDDAIMDGNRITGIICRQSSTELVYRIQGDVFIDATGHGTLGYYAGAEYRYGSESKAEFNEPDAPETENRTTMGNTILFHATDMGEDTPFLRPDWAYRFGEEDLKNRPHGNVTWSHGENGVEEKYDVSSGYWWMELGGQSENIIEETENINDELFKSIFGVWDHIKNMPGHNAENFAMDWIGSVPGIRESRRLVGDYILNENDILENRIFDDGIAFGGWPIDVHPAEGFHHKGLPTRYINFTGHYAIPYRCLYSKNVENLMMAGRDISVSKLAMASTRVMGTCAICGQAAGTAAALSVKHSVTPAQLGKAYIQELRQTLLKEDCYIPGAVNEDPDDLARAATITASGYLKGFEPSKIISGVTRGVGEETNLWQSEDMDKEDAFLKLTFGEAKDISQVRVTFDPDLNIEIMISQTKRRLEGMVKGMPPKLVKDFRVSLMHGETVVFEKTITDNAERLCIINTGEPVKADTVFIQIEATYGSKYASVFEVRVY